MSLSAILFILAYGAGFCATFIHPVFGILTYVFTWHSDPSYQWWGDELPGLRWSFLISVWTLASTFLNRGKLKLDFQMNFGPGIYLLLFTVWMFFVSHGWALKPEESVPRTLEFFKMTVLFFLIIYLVREEKHYNWFIWVILVGVANFGRIAWEKGKNRYLGFAAPNATEENAISAHVVSTLPFLGIKFLKGNRYQRIFLFVAAPFLINLMILANSRGAFLAFIVVGIYSLFLFPMRDKLKVIAAGIAGVVLVLTLANEQFWERQETMETYQKEHSAMTRIWLWRGAVRMIKDHPFGLGARGPEEVVIQYVPEMAEQMRIKGTKTVHNTFLLAGTEWGVPGIILFFAFLIHTFLILKRLRWLLKLYPDLKNRFYNEVVAVELALVGLLVAGTFTNRLYAESLYWYSALSVILRNIIYTELKNRQVVV